MRAPEAVADRVLPAVRVRPVEGEVVHDEPEAPANAAPLEGDGMDFYNQTQGRREDIVQSCFNT
jgi:hypothetical protein